MGYISFSKCKKQLLLPFITPIFAVISSLLRLSIIDDELKEENHFIIEQLLMFLGESCSVIFMLIIGIRDGRKKTSNKPKEEETKYNFVYLVPLQKELSSYNPTHYLFFFFSAVLDLISSLITNWFVIKYLYKNTNDKKPTSVTTKFKIGIVQLLSIAGFTVLIFKIQFYRHQVLSIILTILGLSFFFIKEENNNIYWFIIPYLIIGANHSLVQYIIESKKINPYKLETFQGLFGLLLCLILMFFEFPFLSSHDSYSDLLKYFFNWKHSLYTSMVILNLMIYNLCIVLTIAYFGATMMCISSFFSPLFNILVEIIWFAILGQLESYKLPNYEFEIPGYLLTFIGCLMYSEVIIFNICGLNYNTSVEICKRSDKEYNDLTAIIYPL